MLPTQGLFRSIPCPYYISGLCERPQCLFRHTKSDVILARKKEIEEDEEEEAEASEACSELIVGGGSDTDSKREGSKSTSTGKKRKAERELIVKEEKGTKSIRLESDKNGSPRLPVETSKLEKVCSVPEVEVTGIVIKKENIELVDLTEETELQKTTSSSSSKNGKTSSRSRSSGHHKSSSSKSKSSRGSGDHKSKSHSKHRSSSSGAIIKSEKEKEDKSKKKEDKSKSSSQKNRSSSSSSSSTKKGHSSHKSSSHKSTSSSGNKDKTKSSREKETETISSSNNKSDLALASSFQQDSAAVDEDHQIDEDPSTYPSDIEAFSDYEDDPEDIEQECLRLFENYNPEEKAPETPIVIGNSDSKPELDTLQKKRQAHPGANDRSKTLSSLPKSQKTATSLHAIISKRLESQRNIPLPSTSTLTREPLETKPLSHSSKPPISAQNKKRIAHVANIAGLLKPSISSVPDKSSQKFNTSTSDSNKTIPKTSVKGTNRVAHSSALHITKKRPIVNIDSPSKGSGKIPTAIRQKVLDQLFDAAVNIYVNNQQEAFARAIKDESEIEIRSKTKAVYLSLAVGKVRAIRKEAEEGPSEGTGSATPGVLPESTQSLRLRPSEKGNFSIITRSVVQPTGTVLYQGLKRFILTEDLLVSNGFPRPHPTNEPGRAVAQRIFWEKEYISEPTRRTCDRCRKAYQVTEFGQQVHEDTCTFHPGRKSYHRVNRVWVSQRSCCGDENDSRGCTTTNFHVPKAHPVSAQGGFVASVKSPGSDELMGLDPWDIIAIDCEMVYTTGGNLLARATFVGSDGNVLYDQLVKPPYPVLDYNTQYSGLTAEMLSRATTTLTDVQAVLLTHLKPNALLIGHSLESDLIALRVKHDYVIDTSVLYPHKRGPPYKRALRMITSDLLHRIIQESEHGHDSAEDAQAALELAILHIERARNGDVS